MRTYRYDAWNRLVKIELEPSDMSGVRTIAAYAYNALHWQVRRTADTDSDGDFDESRVMVYSPAWQLLHEEIQFDDEVGGETQPTPTVDLVAQQVGGARGLDDALYRRVDDDPGVDAVYERGFFYVTDASFSVLALLNDTTGYVHERVGYGAYGEPEAWFPEDIDRDGDLTFFDVSAYNAWFNASDPRADFARPWGTINFFDQSQFQGGFNSKERGPGGIADEGPSGTCQDRRSRRVVVRHRAVLLLGR